MKAYNGWSGSQRAKAGRWLNEQWASGALDRPSKCDACGQTEGVIHAHAEDYSEPFMKGKTDEYHLCYRCHIIVHTRHHSPKEWALYRADIAAGARYAPFFKQDWPRFQADHLRPDMRAEPLGYFQVPAYFPLDEIAATDAAKDRSGSDRGVLALR